MANPRPPFIETKPATEWLLGGPVQKTGTEFSHGLMQLLVAKRLNDWAAHRGRVAIEWLFWLAPAGEEERYLVPDVAYLSYERLPADDVEAAEEPDVAPDAVFEIRARDDRESLIEHKIEVYLNSGTDLVAVLDAYSRRLASHDQHGSRVWHETEAFEHGALPDFRLALPALFAELDRRTR